MEITRVNTITKYTPTLIQFNWNNGKKGYVGIENGKMKFYNLIFNKEYETWQYVVSNYSPSESILKAVANMILKYSRAFISDKIEMFKAEYEKYCSWKQGATVDRYAHDRIAARYKMLNYEQSLKEINLFEKVWRGEQNEKAC